MQPVFSDAKPVKSTKAARFTTMHHAIGPQRAATKLRMLSNVLLIVSFLAAPARALRSHPEAGAHTIAAALPLPPPLGTPAPNAGAAPRPQSGGAGWDQRALEAELDAHARYYAANHYADYDHDHEAASQLSTLALADLAPPGHARPPLLRAPLPPPAAPEGRRLAQEGAGAEQ